MELEEMKILWDEMSIEVTKQKKLTHSLIIQMTAVNYKSRLDKIFIPEAISSVLCVAIDLFIVINFQKLGGWYLQLCAVATIFILSALSFLSLRAIKKMRAIDIAGNNYRQTLEAWSKGKLQFMFVQKLSFYLTAVLILVTLPVMSKLVAAVDMFKTSKLWLWYAVIFSFYIIAAQWVYKYYSKTTVRMESLLKELEA